MELEKLINDTQDFTKHIHELFGAQWLGDTSTQVAELSRVIGVLAESTLITEGKRPARPGVPVRLAHDMADVLFMLISISNAYDIDLAQAWNEWIIQTRARLDNGEFAKLIRDRLSASRANRQKHSSGSQPATH